MGHEADGDCPDAENEGRENAKKPNSPTTNATQTLLKYLTRKN